MITLLSCMCYYHSCVQYLKLIVLYWHFLLLCVWTDICTLYLFYVSEINIYYYYYYYCIAPGCTNYFYKGGKQHFHRLPLKNKALLKSWLQKIKRKDPPVNEYARVRSDHFESECYRQKRSFDSSGALVSNATNNLCTDAVPTIFNLAAFSSGMCDAPASSSNVEKSGERKRRLAVRTRKQQHTEVGLFTSYLPNRRFHGDVIRRVTWASGTTGWQKTFGWRAPRVFLLVFMPCLH